MPAWLASLVLQRGGGAMARFAVHYQRLAAMPRGWRRRLSRKLAVSLGSAALIMALTGPAIIPPALAESNAPAATITVVNGEVADVQNNKCSLIEAIINARTTKPAQMRADCTTGNVSGPDTVTLPTNGTFVLTTVHNSQLGDTGLPVINSAVTIDGHGSTIRRENDAPNFRILAVDGNLTLRDTTIANGDLFASDDAAQGGGIYIKAGGQATITGSVITGNRLSSEYGSYGGGIHAGGNLILTDSTVSGNSADGNNYSSGGGISVGGQATITRSMISGNRVMSPYDTDGGGIAIWGQATIIDSVIADNVNWGDEYGGRGGGVHVNWYGQATISGSTISGNVVHYYVEGYTYDLAPGTGGGVSNVGTVTIVNSTLSGNVANEGGGVANLGQGDMRVIHSTLTGNAGENITYDGYIYDVGVGGGAYFNGYAYNGASPSVTLQGVILSGNTADDEGVQAWAAPDQAITVNANNLFGQSNNAGLVGFSPGANDIVPSVGLAAILSPLADNGGPTMTHALPPNSPALDRAPNASCTAAPVNGVDQRGEPRNQNAAGGVTNNECDAGAYERAGAAAAMGFYLSASAAGSMGGVAFAPGDIIRFTPGGGWAMFFDASDVGLTKNVTAFEIEDNGDILLSLAAGQTVAGAGAVQPQDVLRFTPTSTGNNTAGAFSMALDGSANLLTTAGEKIDALGRTNGRLAISTIDNAAVKRPDMTVLKAQDEDALGFNLANSQWSEYFNGTPIPGLKAEDVNGLWIDPATADLYISIVGAFNVAGVAGNGRDIVKLTPNAGAPGGYTASLFWDGSANGFPVNIDGIEMAP